MRITYSQAGAVSVGPNDGVAIPWLELATDCKGYYCGEVVDHEVLR